MSWRDLIGRVEPPTQREIDEWRKTNPSPDERLMLFFACGDIRVLS